MCLYIAYGLLALMEKQEYASITIQQIVAKAGVNRSTYYRHFTSKEDVIRYYFHHVITEYLSECAQQNLTFSQYTVGFYQHFLKYKKQMLLIHKSGQSVLLHEVFRQLIASNSQRCKTPLDLYKAQFQIGGTSNMFLYWFSRGMEDRAEDVAQYMLQLLPQNYTPYLHSTST